MRGAPGLGRRGQFEDALAACNLLPGPASTQMAIFCARRAGGGPLAGLLGGVCFIVPGLVLILALAALFLAASPPRAVLGAGAGAGAAVAAIALRAGLDLLPASAARALGTGARARWLAYVALGAAAAATLGPWVVVVLLGCGLLELGRRAVATGAARRHVGAYAAPAATVVATAGGLGALAWTALKVGALSYGGGFVIVPLMQADAVDRYHWLSAPQFLNAVALGQVTPGPVTHTVAVVGYGAAGLGGGLLAALVAFTPSFASCSAAGGTCGAAPQRVRARLPRRRRAGRDRRDPGRRDPARARPGPALAVRRARPRRARAHRPAPRGGRRAPLRRRGRRRGGPGGRGPAGLRIRRPAAGAATLDGLNGAVLISAFLAAAIEVVEMVAVVVAVGVARSWRAALLGAAAGLVVLVALVAVLGPALAHVSLQPVRLVVGALLLVFGLQWLRKGVLRVSREGWGAGGVGDEHVEFERPPDGRLDWPAFVLSFKGVTLEGLEIGVIVVALGAAAHSLGSAIAGAAGAVVVVGALGALAYRFVARIPRRTLQLFVGAMLTTFGTFSAGRASACTGPGPRRPSPGCSPATWRSPCSRCPSSSAGAGRRAARP